MQVQFILYVNNQDKSTAFYTELLGKKPVLNVPGMTEFELNSQTKLGLMPNTGIAKLFSDEIALPEKGTGIPRCELYIEVEDVDKCYDKALQLGARSINAPQKRDWGDYVGYVMDRDGHIIAFYTKK